MRKSSIFSKNFYPTPPEVVDSMLTNLDLEGKTVLEPQAGKGNILSILKNRGAQTLACELNDDLAIIAAEKSDRFLKKDFFEVKAHEISHVDYIVMNPPFDEGDKHLLHAWEIAPDGCTIISLLNEETLKFLRSRTRRVLNKLVEDHGSEESINSAFKDSERPTGVYVSLVTLSKPRAQGDDEWEGYFDMRDNWEETGSPGILPHNDVVELVNRYVGAVKLWDETIGATDKINHLAGIFNCDICFGAFKRANNYSSITRDEFKKELQKSAWLHAFSLFNMKKYMTDSLMNELNKFVEHQQKVPFTVKNVYKMIDVVVQTQGQRMQRVIVEVFDKLTKHYHDNRFQLEGWKTNSEYRVNKKFILNWGDIEKGWNGEMVPKYSSNYLLDDLTKALCHVTGKNYDDFQGFMQWGDNYQTVEKINKYHHKNGRIEEYTNTDNKRTGRKFGTWYDFGFLEIKGFKKGTMHCKFKDDKVWDAFNKIACEGKGFRLASKFTSDFRQKSTDVEVAA